QLCISTRNDAKHYIIIDFTDTGIGINPELQPRIFDAFEQGGKSMTNRYGGLGLGLAISKRVIDLHGGKISVQSEGQDTGATFTIKLKAMETSLLEGTAYPLDHDGSARDGADILLVGAPAAYHSPPPRRPIGEFYVAHLNDTFGSCSCRGSVSPALTPLCHRLVCHASGEKHAPVDRPLRRARLIIMRLSPPRVGIEVR